MPVTMVKKKLLAAVCPKQGGHRQEGCRDGGSKGVA
jgi:hypothetical protein